MALKLFVVDDVSGSCDLRELAPYTSVSSTNGSVTVVATVNPVTGQPNYDLAAAVDVNVNNFSYNPATQEITLTETDGDTYTIDVSDLVDAETITTLVQNANGSYTYTSENNAVTVMEATNDNGDGGVQVLDCVVSYETTRIDCDNVDGDATGLVHRTIDLKDNTTTSREFFVMPDAGSVAGNAGLTYGVADDITSIQEVIATFTVDTPCAYNMVMGGYYHVRGITSNQFVGNVQHSMQVFTGGAAVGNISFTNVFNNENSNPAPGATGSDPTGGENQVPVGGVIAVPAGSTTYELRLTISGGSNIVEAGQVNFNQFQMTYELPSKICCL